MKSNKMNTYRKTAILVGALFITATVACSFSIFLTEPILNAPDYLAKVSANASHIILAALLMLIDAIAVAAIAIVIFPVLKKHNTILALGYVGARIIESVFFIFYVILLLSVMTVGRDFITAATSEASHFQTTGNALMAVFDWTFTLGYGIIFTLSALILNYSLFQSRLVPRWLSIFGIIGAALSLLLNLFKFYSIELPEILDIVIAVQEMVLAVWLIIKGFNISAIASESAQMDHG